MTEEQIREGSHLIAVFMDAKTAKQKDDSLLYIFNNMRRGGCLIFDNSELKYHTSWDWLIPAIKKFDRIYEKEKIEHYGLYEHCCDEIDDSVTTYEINKAFEALVSAITWYNKKDEYVRKSTFPPTILDKRALD